MATLGPGTLLIHDFLAVFTVASRPLKPRASYEFLDVSGLAKDDIDAAVKTILCRENYVIKEVDKYLQHQDFLNERRREMLHKRWVENVACPLQQKIIDKVGSPRDIEKRKRLELDDYLKFKNAMGYVSLETYDSKTYDPFYMMNKDPYYLKVMVPPFLDPLLKAQRDRDQENRVLLQCERGKTYTLKMFRDTEKAELLARLPQSSLTRQNIGPNDWLAISAGYVESDLCKKSRLKVKVDRNRISWALRKAFYPSEAESEEEETVKMAHESLDCFEAQLLFLSWESQHPPSSRKARSERLGKGELVWLVVASTAHATDEAPPPASSLRLPTAGCGISWCLHSLPGSGQEASLSSQDSTPSRNYWADSAGTSEARRAAARGTTCRWKSLPEFSAL
ncbi:protein FAM228B-like [Gracilinanus agilis]|uniref:protein FAM228B-like n=1 Tax=Gracilinanus agilis TaxID=191870 RepID=UPI001CFC8542|nr:protein FAM228B-like [Gracilinanus agilis]